MPKYDFKCLECGNVSEFTLSVSSDSMVACPSCGSNKMKRMISAPNVLGGRHEHDHAGGVRCCGRTEQCGEAPCSCHEH